MILLSGIFRSPQCVRINHDNGIWLKLLICICQETHIFLDWLPDLDQSHKLIMHRFSSFVFIAISIIMFSVIRQIIVSSLLPLFLLNKKSVTELSLQYLMIYKKFIKLPDSDKVIIF